MIGAIGEAKKEDSARRKPKSQAPMHLKILLPYGVFADKTDVLRIVAETSDGSFGLFPHRLDCVAALVPGDFHIRSERRRHGLCRGRSRRVGKGGRSCACLRASCHWRNGFSKLQDAVKHEFLNLDEQERNVRTAVAKMESSFVGR